VIISCERGIKYQSRIEIALNLKLKRHYFAVMGLSWLILATPLNIGAGTVCLCNLARP
jgi:hypothetical protein